MTVVDGGAAAVVVGSRDRVTVRVENTDHHPAWDAFVERTPGGDLVQTSGWARVKGSTGSGVERLVCRDADGRIAAGVQLIVRRVRGLGAVAYAPYGPVVDPEAPDELVVDLVASILDAVRRQRLRAVFVQPPEHGTRVSVLLGARGFEPSDADVAPSASLRLDVRCDPDELLGRMSRHARGDMRRCLRQPMWVRAGTRDDLPSFAELHANSGARQGFTPTPLPYLRTLWDELAPDGRLAFFVVDSDGVDLAALLLSRFGNRICTRLGGFAPERLPSRLRASELLKWAAVAWARGSGVQWFDLGGVGREAALALASGTRRDDPWLHDGPWGHKIVLGGEPVVMPEPLQLVPNRVLRAGYHALRTNPAATKWLDRSQRALRAASARPRGAGS